MTQRWVEHEGTAQQRSVTLEGDTLVVEVPDAMPRRTESPLAQAFEAPGLYGFARRTRFEVQRALARALPESALASPASLAKRAFLLAYEGIPRDPEALCLVRTRGDGSVESTAKLELHPEGALLDTGLYDGPSLHLADELFAYGPPTHGLPRWHRARLRRWLLEGLPEGHSLEALAAPWVEYESQGAREWEQRPGPDEEHCLSVGPGFVCAAQRSGHDAGYTLYAPERLLTRDRGLECRADARSLEEARALVSLAAASPPERASSREATEEERARLLALRERVVDRAPWPFAEARGYAGFRNQRDGWGEGAALGLCASLEPSLRLPEAPVRVSSREHGRGYNWGEDRAWLTPEGRGVLLAEECFGSMPGDGVDEVFHLAPDLDRRVLFGVGTDYTEYQLDVLLGARTARGLEALRAHVDAYFLALGFGPAKELSAPQLRRRRGG